MGFTSFKESETSFNNLSSKQRTESENLNTSFISNTPSSETNHFSGKVHSKYYRPTVPVYMQQMLSREEQKTLLSIEPPLIKTQYSKALDRFGYKNNSTDEDFNVADLHNKKHKMDRCIIGFENILPRKFRHSIYHANEGI